MEKIEMEEDDYRDPIPGEYGNPIPKELMFRELGFRDRFSRRPAGTRAVSTTLATKAVHTLCTKEAFTRRKFKLPAGARTTFHMAFSPDGTKVASCHGDHNVYVCDVRTGEVLQTLSGHPRTPWCVVFHPTQNDVLASGCLAGHVRVWDLNGGSEVLVTDSGTVIASIAFHPTVRLLVIATFNEIIFWDWDLPYPLARCSTENTKEKVRLVRFDRLGKSLITGITNYPSPPTRENLQTTHNIGAHRPNILSRGAAPRGNNPSYTSYDGSDPASVSSTASNSREDRDAEAQGRSDIAEIAASLAAAAEVEATSSVLNRRQDRFQESYRQLVSHYQDLVSHYQQFLRSRIPRLLETSRLVREQPPTASQPSTSAAATEANSRASRPGQTDEVPGPSRLIQLEARLHEIMNNPNHDLSGASRNTTSDGSSASVPNRLRNDSDLRNIEMLAQNILEMQNLCSQARRDAPLTIETQHIIELQNIRRHLELLQEQTRELQSSIRATLTSLARNSIDTFRSHVIGSHNSLNTHNISTRGSGIEGTRTRGNQSFQNSGGGNSASFLPVISSPNPISVSSEQLSANGSNSSNAILCITIGPRLTASAEIISPESSNANSSSSRAQAPRPNPPNQDLASSGRSSDDPRGSSDSTGNPRIPPQQVVENTLPFRRVIHEYYLGGRREHEVEQHSRNCPFGARDHLHRPPPRLRCLSEMGHDLTLTVWPTAETGLQLETRNFHGLRNQQPLRRNSTSNEQRGHESSIGLHSTMNITINNVNTASGSITNHLFAGSLNWISNDVGVHAQLMMRRAVPNARRTIMDDEEAFENWQRMFLGGFALIPSWARQGSRPDCCLQRRALRRGGSLNLSSCRPRSDSAVRNPSQNTGDEPLTSRGTSSRLGAHLAGMPIAAQSLGASNLGSTIPSSPRSNVGRSMPQQLEGGFALMHHMRIGEDIIPVYAAPEIVDSNQSSHLLEGPLPHVFVFPVGLFLRGTSWENNTQSVGIFWPPVTRDEEENLAEARSGDLVPVHRTGFSTIAVRRSEDLLPRYRIVYDASQLQLSLQNEVSLIIVQPGLLVLDLISTVVNFERPRPLEGTLYVDYISPVLIALERLFTHRPSNTTASVHSSGVPTSASRLARNPTHPYRTPTQVSRGWITSHHGAHLEPQASRSSDVPGVSYSLTLAEPRINLERVDRMLQDRGRRMVQAMHEEGIQSSRNGPYNHHGTTNQRPNPAANIGRSSAQSRTGSQEPGVVSEGLDNQEGLNATRRVIRLAVDTTTGEVRREVAHVPRSHVTRAIESRIERVLNERGNRGLDSSAYTGSSSQYSVGGNVSNMPESSSDSSRVPARPEDNIQLRICMLTQWPHRQASNSVTSSTQTNSNYTGTSSNSGDNSGPTSTSNSAASQTLSRGIRRRHTMEQRNAAIQVEDEDQPVTSRRPRLSSLFQSHLENSDDVSIINETQTTPGNFPSPSADTERFLSSGAAERRMDWIRRFRSRVIDNESSGPGRIRSSRSSRRASSIDSDGDSGTPEISLNSGTNSPFRLENSDNSYQRPTLTACRNRSSRSRNFRLERSHNPSEFSGRPSTSRISAEPFASSSISLTSSPFSDPRSRPSASLPESSRRFVTESATQDSNAVAEPLLLHLRDVLAPLEVSRVDNSVRIEPALQEAEEPEEAFREPHLIVGSAIPFDGDELDQDWHRSSANPYNAFNSANARPEETTPPSELPMHRLQRALASANSVLERIGEATARETISALSLEDRNVPVTITPRPTSSRPHSLGSDSARETLRPEAVGYPFSSQELDRLVPGADTLHVETPSRFSTVTPLSPTPSHSAHASRNTMSTPDIPLVRTIDEATARNAVGQFVSLGEPESILQVEAPVPAAEGDFWPGFEDGVPGEAIIAQEPNLGEDPSSLRSQSGLPSREWFLRRRSAPTRIRVTVRSGTNRAESPASVQSGELGGSARTRLGVNVVNARGTNGGDRGTAASSDSRRYRPPGSNVVHPAPYLRLIHNYPQFNTAEDFMQPESGARFYPGYIPEILITPRARPPNYYTMDAATTAFLSSRIQKWDFSDFYIPDITDRSSGLITASCSLLSDATLDVSSDSEFIAVLQPSDNGSYSAVGIYSLRDETLGESLYTYHFDQNTVSVSISPSCDYIVVGYAGRGPFYRFVHPSRNIGQILSLTREGPQLKLIPVKELFTDTQPSLMSVNCMHWVPVPGYGIIYGTNTGEVVLLS